MKKRKPKKEPKKEIVDESQLRRDLRRQVQIPFTRKEDIRIGGIVEEATNSKLVILNGEGEKLKEIEGPSINCWTLEIDEIVNRLEKIINDGKRELNISNTVPLDCVGLCLSGCEEETTNNQLKDALVNKDANLAKEYVIHSDAIGGLRTGLDHGIAVIAEAGSNAVLIDPKNGIHTCGDWGHMMGDEGGAYWIAHRACKYVFDDIDGFAKAPEEINYVKSKMGKYFNVELLSEEKTDISDEELQTALRQGMLPYFHKKEIDKSFIANFAKEIADGCKEDKLCKQIFREAGCALAKRVIALWTKASNDFKSQSDGLKIICIGSVWQSWEFLKEGFIDEIYTCAEIKQLTLLCLKSSVTSALGACYLAAERINYHFLKSYDENIMTLSTFDKKIVIESQKKKKLSKTS